MTCKRRRLSRKKKWETNLGSWIDECEGSEGESTPKCERSDISNGGLIGDSLDIGDGYGLIGNEDGLIDDEMGLSSTEPSRTVIGVGCRSHREWFITIGFGFGFRPSRMVIGNGLGSYWRWFRKLLATVWVLIGDELGFYRQRQSEAQWTKA
nr:hypothetical protein CFP56_27883 [Quercus suber]